MHVAAHNSQDGNGDSLDISPREAQDMLRERDDAILLDCRTPDEFALASIDEAVQIPMQEIPERVSELEPHRDGQVLVICHAGVRSRSVAQWLRRQGFADARSVAGGIDRWSYEIDHSIPRYRGFSIL
jgi:rhodanese-related sulfurtransferase